MLNLKRVNMGSKRGGVVLGFSDSRALARLIAKKSGSLYSDVDVSYFPDRETHLRLRIDVAGKTVFIVRSLDNPDKKVIELLFAARTAKELGAKRIVLIAPYLCYMRQDKRFKPGEAISSRIIAEIFNRFFDVLITIDPHLHRYGGLNEILRIKTIKLSAIKPMASFIKQKIKNPFIFGPDYESYQWARSVAKLVGCKADVLKKHRYGSETVRIKIKKKLDLAKKDVVIVDDIISTGHTVIEVIKDVKKLGVRRVCCVCTHGIFAENALKQIVGLGAVVFSTNTIQNSVSRIDVSNLIVDEINKI